MSPEQRRAALYVRISDDRRDGAGVARQEQDCRALADANGWEVSGVYSDNSRSAYQGKRRPEFDRMCRDIEAGVVDIVLAWHPDRLTRHPIEFEALVTMIERTGVEVRTVTTGQFDLATASGRMHARNLGTIARYESEHRAERVARASKERAEAGKPHGGTRPFGYRPGGADLDPAEAPVVAELFERFLSGHSLRSLVRELNDREIRSVTGKPWAAITIKGILSNPRYASLRVH
ncbi:MAG: recombinase family protein, partial [Gordonia polyisoprenivorans]|nr:recombinase family protein [Gordonia polyisoprenivorans]